MVYTQSYSQPSILELARAGNFQAIGYWINRELTPQGIYARVQHGRAGYLQILVEFQQEPPADRLIKFICHQLAKLNSPTFIGVRIVARFVGSPEILWQQTVRLVRPKRQPRKSIITWPSNWEIDTEALNFQTLRSLLLMGSTVASFILGCWVSYHEVLVRRGANASATIQTALEKVEVVHHNQVINPAEPTVTLMFAGDVNLSDSLTEVVGKNYSQVFAKMNEYREADLAMINLENAFTRAHEVAADKQQLKHKAAPEYVKVLTEGGVDLVNLANDRIMDYEEPGLADTIETLTKAGIHHLGAGMDLKEARRPQIIEVKGKLIAYLGYYDADLRAAKEGQAGINASYNDRIAADIAVLRDKVDWIIVNYHWGVELSDYPGDWQIDLARFTIDRGADLVVGHHPRVLQGAEIYKGRPIIYSLGNFIFGGNSASDYETAVLRVSLKENKMKAEFLPVVVQNYQPQIVAGEKGEEILRHIGHLSSIFEQPMSSPMVLELEGSDSKTSQNSQPSIPNLPSISATEEPQKTTPAPLMGGRDAEDKRKQNLPVSHTIIEPEKSKVGSETVMPPLLKQAETGETSENDPFIKEPFIKEPFIETPKMEIQSKMPAESKLKTANSKGSDRVIYLPGWVT